MSDEKEIKEAKEAREARREWLKIFSYRWITRNIPYFLFLAGLAVIYIYNGHYAVKTMRSIKDVSRELKELNHEYKTLKSEVMFRSKQSEIAKEVDTFGLKELTVPPYVIRDSAYKADSLKKR